MYLSSLGPDELPGLRAWTLATLSENDQMGWAIDLNEYSSLPSPNSSLIDLRKRRAETRMVIPYRYVAFTRFSEELLLGRELIIFSNCIIFPSIDLILTSKFLINFS